VKISKKLLSSLVTAVIIMTAAAGADHGNTAAAPKPTIGCQVRVL
jgi:hypothetical protein